MLYFTKLRRKGHFMSNKNVKSIAFKVDVDLVNEFRTVVKKSGFSQTFLIQQAMKKIIEELKNGK